MKGQGVRALTYEHIPSETCADLEQELASGGDERVQASRVRRVLSVSVIAAAALLGAVCWQASSQRAAAPSGAQEEFLALDKQGGQGGCEWGVDCHSTHCCTQRGFQCKKVSEHWHSCEKSDDEDVPEEDDDHEEPDDSKCSDAGEDCTDSKCCTDEKYTCKKRTDGMWWKSSCVESTSDDEADDDNDEQDDDDDDWDDDPSGPVHADKCGKDMPSDVRGRWRVAERCSKKLISKMSLDDKLKLLHGSSGGLGFAGYIKVTGVKGKQGTVRLTMNDGPQGYNGYTDPTIGKGTQYPDLIAIAASFDRKTASHFGAAMAEEFRTKGCAVLLGPDVEVVRVPLSGRSFESLSGEDPYLGSQLAHAYVHEVQKRGVIATVKHWLNNNQEKNRQKLDVAVSDRAQHEIYMAPFKSAIDAGAGSVMCSYNKVYGEYACENDKLLRKLLREDLGFKGFVVSDWGAVHSGAKSAKAGLNVEMPEAQYYSNLKGNVPHEVVDELAGQVLAAIYATGQFHGHGPEIDFSWPPPYYHDATSEHHRLTARHTIIQSSVLLKNSDSTLPLSPSGLKVVLVGKACHNTKDPSYGQGSMFSAGGSGYAATDKTITPLDGLRDSIGDQASVHWSSDGSNAHGSDLAVICAAAHEEEGRDRPDLTLPKARELIDAVKQHSGIKKIIMVAIVPGAITTEWIEDVDAAMVMFMPGEQIGPAFAQLLTGKASPAGRLPVTFPKVDEQRFTKKQYPGVDHLSEFSEGTLVGYRWNDAKNVPAAFPFGFGLSYTTFSFSNFKAACNGQFATVSLTVQNTGAREGTAVPQLYVGFKSLLPVVRQLRGFEKVTLSAGDSTDITFHLGPEDWSYYDEDAGAWKSAADKNEEVGVSIGSSSADQPWSGTLSCDGTALK